MNWKGNSAHNIRPVKHIIHPTRGLFFGALIFGALLAFELFNYSTTDFALTDLIGNLRFLDIRWATILALAFCGIDFAGLARLFTPGRGTGHPREVWYLFGAWLLAATMNAMLTWWGVVIAILSHASLGSSVIPSETLVTVVPIFVAITVWIIRVLIIGSFSVAGEHMFSQAALAYQDSPTFPPQPTPNHSASMPTLSIHPNPKPDPKPGNQSYTHSEPTYHPASMSDATHRSNDARK